MSVSVDPLFAKGLAEFRAGRFFEAHEEWEALWITAVADEKLFLQALIQVAAACVHLIRGNAAPGARLLTLADQKLARLEGNFGEINRDFLRREIGEAAGRVGRGDPPDGAAGTIRL